MARNRTNRTINTVPTATVYRNDYNKLAIVITRIMYGLTVATKSESQQVRLCRVKGRPHLQSNTLYYYSEPTVESFMIDFSTWVNHCG